MKYIQIKNWEKFQHYKDRRPTWIKLLIEIIEEFDADGNPKKFWKLPDTAKLTFIALVCLRAHYNKQIPYKNEKWLKDRLGIKRINLQPLVNAGYISINSDAVSKPYQVGTEPYKNNTPERETERDREREKRGRFTPPSLSEVKDYIQEKGYSVNAESWLAFYESKGWKVGKNSMKDWQAAVRTWHLRDGGKTDSKLCVVDRKPGKVFQLNNHKEKVWLCVECEVALDKVGIKDYGWRSPTLIEKYVQQGKAKHKSSMPKEKTIEQKVNKQVREVLQ